MNITDNLAGQILENLGFAREEVVTEAKKSEPKVEVAVVEEVKHSCPLCESVLETPITDQLVENFVNSLVIEESTASLDEEDTEVKA